MNKNKKKALVSFFIIFFNFLILMLDFLFFISYNSIEQLNLGG